MQDVIQGIGFRRINDKFYPIAARTAPKLFATSESAFKMLYAGLLLGASLASILLR